MTWAIIADSSCNLRDYTPATPNCTYAFAPLTLHVGGEEYPDDSDLDVSKLNERVHSEAAASSSACPSAGEWADLFRLADNVIVVTLSSNLSGSYDSAHMLESTAVRLWAKTSTSLILELRAQNLRSLSALSIGTLRRILIRRSTRSFRMQRGLSRTARCSSR